MQTSLVVFDIAGTTVTDNNNVNDAFRKSFETAGYPVPLSDVNKVMGYRKIEAIKILLQQFYMDQVGNEELIEAIHADFTKNMQAYYRDAPDLQPLPYAEDLFRLLQSSGIKVGLNTGFTKGITDTIVERLGWKNSGLIDHIISSDEVPEGRPAPYMIRAIMNAVNLVEPAQVVKVGDTTVDIEEGRNARCGLVISVTTGAYSKEELEEASPDYIIDSLKDLPALLHLQQN
jgi:phosphonatase-like hydrolase